MQLRQSPSMVLRLKQSKVPQSPHWGTPPVAGDLSSQPALALGGGSGRLITSSSKEGALFALWGQS